MRVSLCFRTFFRSLARTVMGNLLVNLMKDFTSVVVQVTCRVSGVFNDPQLGRGHMLEEEGRGHDIIVPTHCLSGGVKRKNLCRHTPLRYESCCAHPSVSIKVPSQCSAAKAATQS